MRIHESAIRASDQIPKHLAATHHFSPAWDETVEGFTSVGETYERHLDGVGLLSSLSMEEEERWQTSQLLGCLCGLA